jgi:hypothetical protein
MRVLAVLWLPIACNKAGCALLCGCLHKLFIARKLFSSAVHILLLSCTGPAAVQQSCVIFARIVDSWGSLLLQL